MDNTSRSGWSWETLRLTAAVTLPGLALFLFSGAFALDHSRVAYEMKRLEAFVGIASRVGGAIHELQVERGLSVAWLFSETEIFDNRLIGQRERSNSELKKLRIALVGLDFESYPDETSLLAKDAISWISRLDDFRIRVDHQEITLDGATENYSSAIGKLLLLVREMSSIASDSRMPVALMSYLDMVEAKEFAGLERALGGVGFAMGEFTEAHYRRFAGMIDAQEVYLDRFHAGASSEQRALLQRQLESEATARVYELRAIALASVENGDTRPVDPVVWFDAATRRILELKGLEDRVNSDLSELTSELAGRALTRLTIVLLGLIALGLALAWTLRREIGARRRARENLTESRAQLIQITDNARDAIITIDPHGTILSWNPSAERMLAYASNEVLGRNVSLIIPQRFRASQAAGLQRLVETGESTLTKTIEVVTVTKASEELEVEISLANWTTARGPVYAAMLRDITERRRAEDRIKSLAYHDVLTGLPNRESFRKKFEGALDSAERERRLMALLFIDLDGFKQINDTLGHSVGDHLLAQVAERLLTRVRGKDCVTRWDRGNTLEFSRLGGDEFTVLLTNLADPQDAAAVAQRVLDVLREPFAVNEHEVFTAASIGIGIYPLDGADTETLLKNADIAMYWAKKRGRNTFEFFTKQMNERANRNLKLEGRLRRALERDELSVHYQPLRDVSSGEISGAEALLRWEVPGLGSVSPEEFIPIAEEAGLITVIGEWVLRAACFQAQAWQEAGFRPIRMAVNLSGRQLRHSTFAETVSKILEESRLSPAFLELEITESAMIENSALSDAILFELCDLGISLSLDDFGTGYSSLSYLKRYPISRVKIDRSFVSQLPTDSDDAALTTAIIVMAHSLGLTVVAEGVETLEQVEFLREVGCDVLQGYLISPAVPAEGFGRFLGQEKRE